MGLFDRTRPVNLPVDNPSRDAPQLTSECLEGRTAIYRNDRCERADRGIEGRNETAERDEGSEAGRIAVREVPHAKAAHGQARQVHAVGVDLELSAHLLK